jgi:hypothetical protein
MEDLISCIGRESNPGLADIENLEDLGWQRPILPLNHQCDESGACSILYNPHIWRDSVCKEESVCKVDSCHCHGDKHRSVSTTAILSGS